MNATPTPIATIYMNEAGEPSIMSNVATALDLARVLVSLTAAMLEQAKAAPATLSPVVAIEGASPEAVVDDLRAPFSGAPIEPDAA